MTDANRAARASALAFAAGLGVAVATGHGVATAEVSGTDGSAPSGTTSTSDSTSSAASSSDPDSSDPTTGVATDPSDSQSEDDSTDSSADESAGEDDSPTADDAPSETDEPADADETDEADAEVPDDADVPNVDEPATEEPAPQAPSEPGPTAAAASGSNRDSTATGPAQADESTATSPTDAAGDGTPDSALSDADGVDAGAADGQATQQVSVTDPAATPTAATESAVEAATLTTTTLQPAVAAPVSAVTAAFVAVADFVVGVATALLSPFIMNGPNGPTGPAASLLELIYVARSRFQDTFFNSSPIVEPVQIAQTGQQVTGTLNAYDADLDRLVYTVTQAPTHGTVVINDDGTFTYTPDDVLGAAGGVDTFEITATEADEFHLHGLRGVFTLGGLLNGVLGLPSAHSASSMVAVAVSATGGTGIIDVGENPQGVALNADGTRAYVTNSGDDSVTVIDVATNTVIHTIDDVGNYPTGVVVGSGNVYVANMFDNTVSVIDTETNTVTAVFEVGDMPQGIALNTDGTRVYVVNTGGNTVSVIDTETNTIAATVEVGAGPQQVALSADGTRAYVTNFDDGTVSVIDAATNEVLSAISVGDTPQAVAVSPDGTRLYVTSYDRGSVSVLDTVTNEVIAAIPVGLYPDAIAVSADGTRAYVTNEQTGSVSVIDTATNAVVGAIPLGDTGSAIAVSPDGTHLYAPNFDAGTLTVSAVNLAAAPPSRRLPGSGLVTGSVDTYWVHNLTDDPVRFVGYDGAVSGLYEGPVVGAVYLPGESAGFSLWPAGGVTPLFETGSPDDPDYARYAVEFANGFGTPSVQCEGGGAGRCSPFSAWDAALIPLSNDVTVPGEDTRLQWAILNSFCRDISRCSFDAISQEAAFTPSHPVGNAVINETESDVSTHIQVSDTQSETSSISVTAKVGVNIKSIVNASISATYGHSWTSSHTFKQSVGVTATPWTMVSLTAVQPVYRVYGNFTVTMGDVTFHLRNAVFDTPNPKGQGAYTAHQIDIIKP